MGESGDSERNYGLSWFAKNAIDLNESRGDLEVTSQIAEQGLFWASFSICSNLNITDDYEARDD